MIPFHSAASASSQFCCDLNCQLFTQVITVAVILCKYNRWQHLHCASTWFLAQTHALVVSAHAQTEGKRKMSQLQTWMAWIGFIWISKLHRILYVLKWDRVWMSAFRNWSIECRLMISRLWHEASHWSDVTSLGLWLAAAIGPREKSLSELSGNLWPHAEY